MAGQSDAAREHWEHANETLPDVSLLAPLGRGLSRRTNDAELVNLYLLMLATLFIGAAGTVREPNRVFGTVCSDDGCLARAISRSSRCQPVYNLSRPRGEGKSIDFPPLPFSAG